MFNASPAEQKEAAITINVLAENGNWHPPIGRRMKLAEAAEAHRLQEENTIGKKGTLAGKIVLVP